VYKEPLELLANDKDYPDMGDLHRIFGNLEAIIGVNTTLLTQLDEMMYLWDEKQKNQLVGPLFVKMVQIHSFSSFSNPQCPFLHTYDDYCANYLAAIKLLEALEASKPKFAEFLSEKLPMCLLDLLITPVQRTRSPWLSSLTQEYLVTGCYSNLYWMPPLKPTQTMSR
jgi:hypothetical protein